MESSEPVQVAEKKDRKQQLKEAQKRYYEKHKKPKEDKPIYSPEKIQEYHKAYYQKNKEKINARAKEFYKAKKEAQKKIETENITL